MAIMAVRELHSRNQGQRKPAPFQARMQSTQLPCLVSCKPSYVLCPHWQSCQQRCMQTS